MTVRRESIQYFRVASNASVYPLYVRREVRPTIKTHIEVDKSNVVEHTGADT